MNNLRSNKLILDSLAAQTQKRCRLRHPTFQRIFGRAELGEAGPPLGHRLTRSPDPTGALIQLQSGVESILVESVTLRGEPRSFTELRDSERQKEALLLSTSNSQLLASGSFLVPRGLGTVADNRQ